MSVKHDSSLEEELGVWLNEKLNVIQQCVPATQKANLFWAASKEL